MIRVFDEKWMLRLTGSFRGKDILQEDGIKPG